MNTSPESMFLFKFTLLFMIIAFLITSIMACVVKDEKKADNLRVKSIAMSFLTASFMVVKLRVDIFVFISCCLFIITFITFFLKKEILEKIFFKWIVCAYVVLIILSLISFRFSEA